MDMMRDFIEDNVRPRMSGVPGVSEVNVGGGAERQIQVHLNPERLAERGITLTQVRDAIRERNRDLSGGEVESGKRRYLLRTMGRFEDLEDQESMILERRGDSITRLSDVARTVTLNIIPPRSVALETGVERVRNDVVAHLQNSGQVPAGVTLNISGAADQLDATRESLSSNYLVALVIVYLLMVAIFTHWGYPLLIMTTIPLGIAGGIAGLALLNLVGSISAAFGFGGVSQPFDMISMLGFLILMGTVVNNPILIVHRAISNVKEEAMDAVHAVREAVSSRLRPIAISTITTIVGLAPLVFLPGAGSELYRGVGVIVMAGIIGATLVTLTMLPSLTVMVLNWTARKNRYTGSQH